MTAFDTERRDCNILQLMRQHANMSRGRHSTRLSVPVGPQRTRRSLVSTPAGLFFSVLLFGAGCAEQAEPVATVSLGVNRASVPLGGPIELAVRFVASPRLEGVDGDYRVLVHFLNSDQDLMWAADHDLPTPTSDWRPGQTIEYTHRTTVPMYPYVGEATVAVGLYSASTGERLALAAEDLGQRAYRGTTIELEPQAESSFLLYEGGWHPSELNRETNRQWRWTSERASLSFRNPRSNAVLYLELEGRPDLFDDPQKIDVVGEETLQQILVDSPGLQFVEVELEADQLGDEETVTIDLLVDPTFVPAETTSGASEDNRRLGVRVFYAFLEPR